MKYETFLNDANIDFAKYYLNIYRTVRKKRASRAFAERLLVDASDMGGVLETMVREGFNPGDLDRFEKHLNSMRYVVKVLYKNNYIRRRRAKRFLVAARELEYFVSDPIEVSKITGKRDRKRLERIFRKRAAEEAFVNAYDEYMDSARKADAAEDAVTDARIKKEEEARRKKAAEAAARASADPDGFEDIYVEPERDDGQTGLPY
ncbi:MAG: hypothetical protein LUD47_05965 [Clostridia bacterium]|nr:hypothetical protein [Clostridia bacterium]